MAGEQITCPVCGETAPEPASMCLHRFMATMEYEWSGSMDACDYSEEGQARVEAELNAAAEAFLDKMASTPTPTPQTGEGKR